MRVTLVISEKYKVNVGHQGTVHTPRYSHWHCVQKQMYGGGGANVTLLHAALPALSKDKDGRATTLASTKTS